MVERRMDAPEAEKDSFPPSSPLMREPSAGGIRAEMDPRLAAGAVHTGLRPWDEIGEHTDPWTDLKHKSHLSINSRTQGPSIFPTYRAHTFMDVPLEDFNRASGKVHKALRNA